MQYIGEKPTDPIELRVYRGADGEYALYEDEGVNYNYERGARATIPIRWDDEQQKLTIGKRSGKFSGMTRSRTFRIVWVRPGTGVGDKPPEKVDSEIRYSGQPVTVRAPEL
jgi:alpha-D-xyloside xylohydrolase